MLDFICIGFAELWVSEGKRKIQNENMSLRRDIKPASPCIPARRCNHSAIKTVNDF